jgi:hypothetical protein
LSLRINLGVGFFIWSLSVMRSAHRSAHSSVLPLVFGTCAEIPFLISLWAATDPIALLIFLSVFAPTVCYSGSFLFAPECTHHARKVLFFFWAGSQVRSVFFVALKSGVCLAVLLDLIFPHLCVLVSHQSSFRSVFSSMGILAFNACGSFGFLSTVSI